MRAFFLSLSVWEWTFYCVGAGQLSMILLFLLAGIRGRRCRI